MTLENKLKNKGLELVREHDAEKAAETVANILCGGVATAGAIGAFLFMTDMNSNHVNGGWSWQPSWTPGYEINHDGVRGLNEWGYLIGYLGSTAVGGGIIYGLTRRFAKPLMRRLQKTYVQRKDEEFNANYDGLSGQLASKETIGRLNQDYQDALYLDLLASQISGGSAEGAATVPKISRKDLAVRIIKEQAKNFSDETLNAYLPFLATADVVSLARHYIGAGELERAEKFVTKHKEQITNDINGGLNLAVLKKELAGSYFQANKLSDAERLWNELRCKEELTQLSAAYRNVGDEKNAARAFADYSQ